MQRALAGLLALLILTSATAISSAQEEPVEEKVILFEYTLEIVDPHPWMSRITCLKISCVGMELQLEMDGHLYTNSDSHEVELSAFLLGNVTIRLLVDDGTSIDDTKSEVVSPFPDNLTTIESGYDEPDTVPSAGQTVDSRAFEATWPCTLIICDAGSIVYSYGYSFIGALESGSDKDAILILGEAGDVIRIPMIRTSSGVEYEFWQRNDASKSLIDIEVNEELGWHQFDYPSDGELWIRFTQDAEGGYAAYQFSMIRYSADTETPWGELSNPWQGEPALDFRGSDGEPAYDYLGTLTSNDAEGDALLFKAGSRMEIGFTLWSSPSGATFEIWLHEKDGSSILAVEDGVDLWPSHVITSEDTITIEIRIVAITTTWWRLALHQERVGDGDYLGDAPDRLWTDGDEAGELPLFQFGEEVNAYMLLNEDVDVFAFEISDVNGSKFYLKEEIPSALFYQILILNQTTGAIENTSLGMPIDAPAGIHAVRVERTPDFPASGHYAFTLVYLGDSQPAVPVEYIDQSDLFLAYYVFAGVFLLAPAFVVLYWNRRQFFGGAADIEIEAHERRRLRRLRERLTALLSEEVVDEQVLESSLHQLGDSPWQAVVADWGEPLLRHNTAQVEICIWRIAEGGATLLVGIRIADSPWELAAMRVHAPEGATLAIADVSPRHLFQGDEIFLDTLRKGSKTFLRLTLEGEPSNLGFQLSGLVDGEPLAAVPNRSIEWS